MTFGRPLSEMKFSSPSEITRRFQFLWTHIKTCPPRTKSSPSARRMPPIRRLHKFDIDNHFLGFVLHVLGLVLSDAIRAIVKSYSQSSDSRAMLGGKLTVATPSEREEIMKRECRRNGYLMENEVTGFDGVKGIEDGPKSEAFGKDVQCLKQEKDTKNLADMFKKSEQN